ncbi:hypothetical protein SAMN05421837_11855 [Amycolatopsis pretoriensis]|uniref:Uncharacterized protein n=1 Tax=Amycolatopsis pretoriensis TaxID=218821 RepID=A0A1H5RJ41_9PSEU|nr:hypothetical protein SAMN05421837_11855 [Amycolatopsis pretoriensis]
MREERGDRGAKIVELSIDECGERREHRCLGVDVRDESGMVLLAGHGANVFQEVTHGLGG